MKSMNWDPVLWALVLVNALIFFVNIHTRPGLAALNLLVVIGGVFTDWRLELK